MQQMPLQDVIDHVISQPDPSKTEALKKKFVQRRLNYKF